jgi:hypothetical protein
MAAHKISDPMITEILDELMELNASAPAKAYQHYCLIFPVGEIGWREKVRPG